MPGLIVVQKSGFGLLSARPYNARPTRFFSARVIAASRCISTCAMTLVTSFVEPVARLLAWPFTVKPMPCGCGCSASSLKSGT
jgi:hypothetical protein